MRRSEDNHESTGDGGSHARSSEAAAVKAEGSAKEILGQDLREKKAKKEVGRGPYSCKREISVTKGILRQQFRKLALS